MAIALRVAARLTAGAVRVTHEFVVKPFTALKALTRSSTRITTI